MTINLETLLNWSAPKRVRTSKGERDLLKAAPNEAFSKLWKANKAALAALGLGWVKDGDVWQVVWWRPIAAAEAQAKAETLAASKATDAQIAIPANPGLEYLGYQKAGVRYALGRDGTLIADEMGLGKTIQAIGMINANTSIKSVVIVCPASIKLNWARELRKWLTRPMSIQLVGAGAGWGKADITIINFENLAKYEAQISTRTFELAVIDESHRIKNAKAQCTKVATQIKATHRVAMTGTPILNRPIELWTTLLWLEPTRWNKKSSYFQTRYCGAFMGQWGWVNDGASHLDELQEVLRTSVMIRRLKKDVLTELPPKIRQVIELEGDANAKKAAKAELAKWRELQAAIDEAAARKEAAAAAGDDEAFEDAVAELSEAQGVAFEAMSVVRHETALAKVPMVVDFALEVLEEADKIVIFAHHQDVVDQIMTGLNAYNPVKLVGGQSETVKQAAIDVFQNDPKCRVFVGSTLAAGIGITLTAASHVIFAELDWTPARVSQAEDRCHRIGQLSSVLVQHLVLEGSLDAYMAGMIVDKQRIADKALDKGAPKIDVKQFATEVTVTIHEVPQTAISQEKVQAAHQAMKILAGMCDGARSLDDHGFNKLDTHLGKSLALAPYLSQKQAAIAVRFATKYRRQLPSELVAAINGRQIESS
jgi:SWI/SNF-related matrix-associated actin-dependent regulator 1 of chromatin subfamily A